MADPDRAPAPAPAPAGACRRCGAVPDGSGSGVLAWVAEREPGGLQVRLCPDCARRHLRDIEAKLPHEWW